jgi:hypothetical protein
LKILAKTFQNAPLLVMNGFSGFDDMDAYRLVTLMIQSMFPPINVEKVNFFLTIR